MTNTNTDLLSGMALDFMRLQKYAAMTAAARDGNVKAFSDGAPTLFAAILEYVALSLHCERAAPAVVALFPVVNVEAALMAAMGPDAYRAAITAGLNAAPALVEALAAA